jgi:alcohol dehydrogenase
LGLDTRPVRAEGHVLSAGVDGKPATLDLESIWGRNVSITTGLVGTSSTPTLLAVCRQQRAS